MFYVLPSIEVTKWLSPRGNKQKSVRVAAGMGIQVLNLETGSVAALG